MPQGLDTLRYVAHTFESAEHTFSNLNRAILVWPTSAKLASRLAAKQGTPYLILIVVFLERSQGKMTIDFKNAVSHIRGSV